MHDDLIDAVNWAVAEGIADTERVAIMGGSYGGYAALVGADVHAGGVPLRRQTSSGRRNLETLLASIPPYWQPFYENLFTARRRPAHRGQGAPCSRRARRSPAPTPDPRPLLIGQGANDPRVKQAESDQIVAACKARGCRSPTSLFPDEGHGFVRPANRISFYAIIEAFLAQHLGGTGRPGAAAPASSRSAPICVARR